MSLDGLQSSTPTESVGSSPDPPTPVGGQDGRATSPAPDPQPPRAKRAYTVSAKVLAANRANLEKARAVPKEIRLRNTPARQAARRRNLERAWARNRDPEQVPAGGFLHGADSKNLRRSAPLCGEKQHELEDWLNDVLRLEPIPPRPEFLTGLARDCAEQMWRVRRVVSSRLHRERLRFYQALFEAADTPGGLTVERVVRLAERLAVALDLTGARLERWMKSLERQKSKLRGRVRRFRQTLRALTDGGKKPVHRHGNNGNHGSNGAHGADGETGDEERDQQIISTEPWQEWLRREYGLRGWEVPADDPNSGLPGFALHLDLVRTAVVGAAQRSQTLPYELEAAIIELGRVTSDRLEALEQRLESATEGARDSLKFAAELKQEVAEKAANHAALLDFAAQRRRQARDEEQPQLSPAERVSEEEEFQKHQAAVKEEEELKDWAWTAAHEMTELAAVWLEWDGEAMGEELSRGNQAVGQELQLLGLALNQWSVASCQ